MIDEAKFFDLVDEKSVTTKLERFRPRIIARQGVFAIEKNQVETKKSRAIFQKESDDLNQVH